MRTRLKLFALTAALTLIGLAAPFAPAQDPAQDPTPFQDWPPDRGVRDYDGWPYEDVSEDDWSYDDWYYDDGYSDDDWFYDYYDSVWYDRTWGGGDDRTDADDTEAGHRNWFGGYDDAGEEGLFDW